MYLLGPNILKLMPSAYTVAQELERYKMGVLQVSHRTLRIDTPSIPYGASLHVWRAVSFACLPILSLTPRGLRKEKILAPECVFCFKSFFSYPSAKQRGGPRSVRCLCLETALYSSFDYLPCIRPGATSVPTFRGSGRNQAGGCARPPPPRRPNVPPVHRNAFRLHRRPGDCCAACVDVVQVRWTCLTNPFAVLLVLVMHSCRRLPQAYDLDFPPGLTVMGVDYDDLTNGEQNAPSIFSSAGLSAGAFLKSPYDSHPAGSNASAPDIQVCAELEKPSLRPACFFFLSACRHNSSPWLRFALELAADFDNLAEEPKNMEPPRIGDGGGFARL